MLNPSQIIFLRHGKVDLPFESHEMMPFSTLRELGTGDLDPAPNLKFARARLAELEKTIDFKSTAALFTSPSKRCIETGALIHEIYAQDALCTISPLIAEIHFDLSKLDHGTLESSVREDGMSVLNDAVFAGMLNGECETTKSGHDRIDRFFSSLPEEGNILCLCHDFIMRVIELYIRSSGTPFTSVSKADLVGTFRNGYLQGFRTNRSLSKIDRIE